MDIEKAFRPAKEINEDQLIAVEDITKCFVTLANGINVLPESREKSLCLTKLQEAKFWAIECVVKNDIDCK